MTLEELKKMLEDGTITQEAFDALSKGLENPAKKNPDPDDDELEKRIQSAIDRATNKLGNDNKALREKLAKLEKEKLTDEERKNLEIEEKEREINERAAALKLAENKMAAIKAIKKVGLDDGSDESLELVDFVLADGDQAIEERAKSLKKMIDKLVQIEVDKTFRATGRDPKKGNGGNGEKNPYSKENWNITEQMIIETTDPERAKQLQAAVN